MYRLVISAFLLLFLFSCDTPFNSKGFVIDKSTGLPVDGVKIFIKGLDSLITDTTGKYVIDTMIYGVAV